MPRIDRVGAERFIWSAARLLDRHRYAMLFAGGPVEPVLAALTAYRNDDGGFGHALEPDLRCPQSQPVHTLTALEVLHEAGRLNGEPASGATAWLESISVADGGIPPAVPGFEDYPHPSWWGATALDSASFLTFGAAALLLDRLPRATEWCWKAIERVEKPSPYWLKYAFVFLDAVPDEERARAAVEALASRFDPEVLAPVGGAEGERLRPLDLSPRPGSRSRTLFSDEQIAAHLDEVEAGQLEDGGWMFDWAAWSPAQTAAWRGIVTIRALIWLRDNGREI
jgi:hypothetical protein